MDASDGFTDSIRYRCLFWRCLLRILTILRIRRDPESRRPPGLDSPQLSSPYKTRHTRQIWLKLLILQGKSLSGSFKNPT